MKNEDAILKDYYIFDVDKNKCPIFTQKNILLLNALLKYNSSYSAAEDEDSGEYEKSYAGILRKGNGQDFFDCLGKQPILLKTETEAIEKNDAVDEDGYEKDAIYKVIESIDKINSTHLSSEGAKGKNKGRVKTAQKIRGIIDLKQQLEIGEAQLVNEIARVNEITNDKGNVRNNFSFATKFCSYVCRYALDDKYKNNYCIYDEVVQSILPYYIKRYIEGDEWKTYCKTINENSKKRDKRIESVISDLKEKDKGYEEYRQLIKKIIDGIERVDGIRIDNETFDHMLWYYFKGSKSKVQKAMNSMLEKD